MIESVMLHWNNLNRYNIKQENNIYFYGLMRCNTHANPIIILSQLE